MTTMTPDSRITQTLQFFLIFYVAIAVLYTTNILFVAPMRAGLSILLYHPMMSSRSIWPSYPSRTNVTSGKKGNRPGVSRAHGIDSQFPEFSGGKVSWNSSDLALEYGLGSIKPVLVDDSLVLSKSFANSMRPSRIIPYFYRASGNFDEDDITITTLVTSNRFHAFSRLVERYQGPISVTIHVRNTTTHIRETLRSLQALYAASDSMATFVDVHLVIDSFDRQFNTWRNIARLFARTDYVMMLDVDFYICTDFRTAVRRNKLAMDKLRSGHSAFVIPAFEYVKYAEGVNHATFPKDKRTLLNIVKSKRIGMFHASWAPGHNSTDYDRYYTAPPGDIYKVTHYQSAYEPYVILKKEGPPWCDERFVGYGGNKAACLFEMYISGMSFYVLADHFIIHQNHRYEEIVRKNERKYNRKLYSEFKEEICFRFKSAFSLVFFPTEDSIQISHEIPGEQPYEHNARVQRQRM
ncbi:LARGE xylosyl- and glucuronyltransferase 2 [Hypsizygus marmoreus]|uniref:LARGE xylosyl- and glucuronyltransferase 2 n=1 Tax=Hypsizygus marmoreus TaxID=39966 RepID=A0A369JCD0_HYPMA|nr:LARGE xylosyl- and glucuronyltransferase 2 [Hypsizygus marmoreus]